MGIAKEKANEEAARGYDDVGKFVCQKCIGDSFLRKTIRLNASQKICDYCKAKAKKNNIAAPVEKIIEIILEGINDEWAYPNNTMAVDNGEWQGEVFDIWDMIYNEIQYEAEIENEDLLNDIRESIHDRGWCIPNGMSELSMLSSTWDRFSNLIKHKYRYSFYQIPEVNNPESHIESSVYPKIILKILSQIIKKHKCLIMELPKGSIVYRARCFKQKPDVHLTVKELGTPPKELATLTNRMSPSGIPLFYGALEVETAAIETDEENDQYKVIANFKTLTDLKILNLCNLPKMPSLFDRNKKDVRDVVKFLREFTSEISKPIDRDGVREHIEYVPSQVFSEYIRYIFKYKKQNINGIFFSSSKARGGICCALYIENECCVDKIENSNSNSYILQLIDIAHADLDNSKLI